MVCARLKAVLMPQLQLIVQKALTQCVYGVSRPIAETPKNRFVLQDRFEVENFRLLRSVRVITTCVHLSF